MQRGTRMVSAFCLAALAVAFLLATSAHAQTYSVIYNFAGGSDGATPFAGVTFDSAGSMYGTASAAGRRGYGDVYRLVPGGSGWTFYLLYTFRGLGPQDNDGAGPYSRVTIGPDGALYGSTISGGDGDGCRELHGCGTVYRVSPKPGQIYDPWEETVLYRFGTYDGSDPYFGDVVFDSAGNLYGTTRNGGANLQGAVYKLTPLAGNWTEQVIYSFAGMPDGSAPLNGPVLDQSGNLYGITYAGGVSGWGTVYRLSLSGSTSQESVLYSFHNGGDGLYPTSAVFLDASGNLYGATQTGGADGGGAVFELTPSGNGAWSVSTVYGFSGPGLANSYRTLTMDRAGYLYGTDSMGGAHGQGSVFKLTPSNGGWICTTLHDFTGGEDGGAPYGVLSVNGNGNIYGTASTGGAYGNGVVFEIVR